MSLIRPRLAKADLREADTSPREDATEAGKVDKPVEDDVGGDAGAHVRKQADEERDADGGERAALPVDVAQEPGGLLLLGHGGEDARAGEEGRVGDGEDGDEDHGVHDGVEAGDARVLDRDDEGGGGWVVFAAEEARVVVGDEEADNEDGYDVELCYWDRLARSSLFE